MRRPPPPAIAFMLLVGFVGAVSIKAHLSAASPAASPARSPAPPRSERWPVRAERCTGHAVPGDFNGDGRAELVTGAGMMYLGAGHAGPNLRSFTGTRNGLTGSGQVIAGFEPGKTIASSAPVIDMNDLVSADFNGDGHADLAYVTTPADRADTDRLMIAYGGKHGLHRAAKTRFATMPHTVTGMAAGDVDGDGCADLVLASAAAESEEAPDPYVAIVRGGRSGLDPGSAIEVRNGLGGFGLQLAVGDVTGDGTADLVVTNPERWDDGGGSGSGSGFGTPRPPRKLQDSRITVVPGTVRGPAMDRARYLTLSGRTLGVCRTVHVFDTTRFDPGFSSRCLDGLVLADLTGDHRADLAAVALGADATGVTGGDLLLFRSRGVDLAPPVRLAAADGTDGYQPPLAVGDVTGDARPDLAAGRCERSAQYYAKHQRITVFTGAGKREVGTEELGLSGHRLYENCGLDVALHDHDGDGHADLDVGSVPIGWTGPATVRVYEAARPGPAVRHLPSGMGAPPGLLH